MRMYEGVLDKGEVPGIVRKRDESFGPQEKSRLCKHAAKARKKIENEAHLRRYLVEKTMRPLKQINEALEKEEKWKGICQRRGVSADGLVMG